MPLWGNFSGLVVHGGQKFFFEKINPKTSNEGNFKKRKKTFLRHIGLDQKVSL